MSLIHKQMYITKKNNNFNLYSEKVFYKIFEEAYALPAFAKSEAEPGNSNDLSTANSTPKACFFVRSLRTPKENAHGVVLSMVAFNGKGFALCCFPLMTVFQPVKRYRPVLESKAIAQNQLSTEQIAMIYKFLCLNRTKQTYNQEAVYIEADSEENARFQLTADYRLLLDRPIGKFHNHPQKQPPLHLADFPQNLTRCDCTKQHEFLYETTINPINVGNYSRSEWENIGKNPINVQKTILHPFALIGYSAPVVAKSTASREKLNDLPLANSSTPLTRAFFVRSLRTPKENAFLKNKERSFLSMVGRIGQRLGVGCLPMVAVSHPDTLYRPAVRSKAVDIQKLPLELSQMFYKFLFTGSRLRITVFANNLAEAYKRLPLSQTQPVLIARLPVQGGVYA